MRQETDELTLTWNSLTVKNLLANPTNFGFFKSLDFKAVQTWNKFFWLKKNKIKEETISNWIKFDFHFSLSRDNSSFEDLKYEQSELEWMYSGEGASLHTGDMSSTPNVPCGPWSKPEVIPQCTAKCNPSYPPSIDPKQNKNRNFTSRHRRGNHPAAQGLQEHIRPYWFSLCQSLGGSWDLPQFQGPYIMMHLLQIRG